MILARNRTPAGQASQRPSRPRTYGQAELRDRRRAGLITQYDGKFHASREIAETAGPLAVRITDLAVPLRFRRLVLDFADAAHEFAGTMSGWLAEADAYAKTTHLANEPGTRRHAMTTLMDLAQRPALPEFTDAMIIDGSWAAALTAMAEPVDKPLAALLARSHPPNANVLRGQLSRSERLVRLLAQTIDRAALDLERKLDWAESRPPTPPTIPTPTDSARAKLAALGIQT